MNDPYASPAMICRITGRKYRPAQRRKLDQLGIPYIEAADGAPLVLVQNLPDHQPRNNYNGEPRLQELKR